MIYSVVAYRDVLVDLEGLFPLYAVSLKIDGWPDGVDAGLLDWLLVEWKLISIELLSNYEMFLWVCKW